MAFTPYNLVGNRPDYSDKQVIVFPEATPLLSFCAEETATNDSVTYIFDQPNQPAPKALLSGQDTTNYKDQFANRSSFTTYTQELEETFGIENRQVSNDPVALANQLASAEMRARQGHQREIEVVLGSDQAPGAQTGGTPYLSAGQGWFQTTTNTSIDASYRANAADATAMASVTRATIEAVLQTLVDNQGFAGEYVLFANSALYGAIANAYLNSSTTSRVQFMHQGNRTIDLQVMTISTVFGSFDIVLAPYMGAASTINGNIWSLGTTQKCRGYLVRKGILSIAFKSNQKNKVSYHEDKGAGPRGTIRSVFGLKNYAPKSCGMFNATSLT